MSFEFEDESNTADERSDGHNPEREVVWDNKRRHKRQSVNWPACCKFGDKEWNVTIVDASNGGFGLDTRLPITPGTNLQIAIHQVGQFGCRIAWASDTRCGLELLRDQGDLTESQEKELCSLLSRANRNQSLSISASQLDQLGALLK